jgi:hypothetical protein
MVTYFSTSRVVQCLYMAERTRCPVLIDLWLYVTVVVYADIYRLIEWLLTRSPSTIPLASTTHFAAAEGTTRSGWSADEHLVFTRCSREFCEYSVSLQHSK